MPTNPTTGQTDLTDPVARFLLRQAMATQPMHSPLDLAGRLAQFGVGSWLEEDRRSSDAKEIADYMKGLPGLGDAKPEAASTAPTAPTAPSGVPSPVAGPSRDIAAASQPGRPDAPAIPRAGVEQDAAAITRIEAGGRYDAVGPPTVKGDPNSPRALGKYQVMPANVGPWTQEVLGKAMTPQEFLASPEAQERVFQTKFGQLKAKYGPEAAARAWFTGSPTGKGTDVNGMTGDRYVQEYRAGLPAPGVQTAQATPPTMTDIGRQTNAIPPDVQDAIKRGLASKNAQVRAAAMGLYQKYATPDPPAEVEKYYNRYAREEAAAGRRPMSFIDFGIKWRSAGTNQFSVNTPPAERAADVEAAKLGAGRLKDLGEAADSANKMVPNVIRIEGLLNKVATGKFAPAKITIGQYARSLGIDAGAMGLKGDELVNAETLRSLMIGQVTQIAKTLGANPTNYDAQLLAQQMVNLENTPEGNKQILKTTKDAIDFARRYETAASAYFQKNRHLHGFAEEFGAKEDERRRKAGLPTFSQPEPEGAPPAVPPAEAAPKAPEAPPPDADGRQWTRDKFGRRYYTKGGRWFNEDGSAYQMPGAR